MNCQTVAATLAVLICDDGFKTWDILEDLHFFNTQSLFVPLIHLQYNHETDWADPRMFLRGKNVAMTLRKRMRAGRSEEDESARNAAVENSLIGNLHTWYALLNSPQGSRRRAPNRGEYVGEYPLGRLMSIVGTLSEIVKEMR